jgi:hypothetical protein
MLEVEPLQVRENLSYEEFLIAILAQKKQVICNKTIPMAKVLWSNHTAKKEASWEHEEEMREKYPYLFE